MISTFILNNWVESSTHLMILYHQINLQLERGFGSEDELIFLYVEF